MIELLKLIATPIFAGGGVWFLICRIGFFLDDKIDNRLREQIHQLLQGANRVIWPELFLSMFDHVFSANRSGRPMFWRSALASCIALFVVTAIYLITLISRGGSALEDAGLSWELSILLAPYVVIVNVIGDYFSLWESRFVIGKMADRKSARFQLLLLIFDAISSTSIFLVGVVLGTASFFGIWVLSGGDLSFGCNESWINCLLSEIEGILSSLFLDGGLFLSDSEGIGDFFGILLYTTFFTSVWVWSFLIGVIVLPTLVKISGAFKVGKHPVGAAMCTGGAAVGLVTVVLTALGIL